MCAAAGWWAGAGSIGRAPCLFVRDRGPCHGQGWVGFGRVRGGSGSGGRPTYRRCGSLDAETCGVRGGGSKMLCYAIHDDNCLAIIQPNVIHVFVILRLVSSDFYVYRFQ